MDTSVLLSRTAGTGELLSIPTISGYGFCVHLTRSCYVMPAY
jgi:hypothetical protein